MEVLNTTCFPDTSNLAEELVKSPLKIKSNEGQLQDKLKGALRELIISRFYLNNREDNRYVKNKIYMDALDTNQIWAQISRRDQQLNNQIHKSLKSLLKMDEIELAPPTDNIEEKIDEIDEDLMYHNYINDDENRGDHKEVEKDHGGLGKNKKQKDLFFSINEMNRFVEEGDDFGEDEGVQLDDDDEEGLDEFDYDQDIDELQDNDQDEDFKYEDVYGSATSKQKPTSGEDDEELNDEDVEDAIFEQARDANEMSSARFVNEDMEDTIRDIEDRMVGKKGWQMTGEITAKERPMNSLLEEHFDFNVASKAVPTITEANTNKLEETIKQRILDEVFDDPIRKQPQEKRKDIDVNEFLSFEKNQKGLGDIYEEDYNKSVLNYARNPAEDSAKQEIEIIMTDLFNQLNTLSNFHFTPKFVDTQIKIQTNLPAFKIEEKVPFSTSEAGARTAVEMFNRRDATFVDRAEMARNEKKRMRNKKKRAIHTHLKNKMTVIKERNRAETGVQMTKFEAKQILKSQISKKADKKEGEKNGNKRMRSSDFFTNMQETAKNDIMKRKKQKLDNSNLQDNEIKSSSKKFKL